MRAILALCFFLGCGLGCDEASPAAPAAEAECPPNVAMGGPCARSRFCIAPPPVEDGVAVDARYPDCPSSHPVPPTEPSNVGEPAALMAGDTCRERRARGGPVCCYEYTTTCAR